MAATNVWPAKDPDEIADFAVDWIDDLGADTILTETFEFVSDGGLTIVSHSHDDRFSTVFLSGGNDGETAVLTCRITTNGGRTFECAGVLPIRSSYTQAPEVSGYNVPMAETLVALYPKFGTVDGTVIAANIARAMRSVDESWTEGDYQTAIMLLAAHYMTLAGLGGTADDRALASVAGAFETIRSASLTLTSKGPKSGAESVPDQWAGSAYGRQFWFLLRQNRGGPRVAVAPTLGVWGLYPSLAPYGNEGGW